MVASSGAGIETNRPYAISGMLQTCSRNSGFTHFSATVAPVSEPAPERPSPIAVSRTSELLARPRLVVEQRNLTLEAFRALSDPIRLELMALIAARGPVCVCHLQDVLPYAQPRISKHLAVLRRSGLVTAERRGTWAFYSLNQEAFAEARGFLDDIEASVRTPRLADSCPEPGGSA